MIRQTRAAAMQIEALFEHFLARDRDGAARNLLRAVREALDPAANASRFGEIEVDPAAGRPHPGPYRGRWGYRWIKVRRYWFGYAAASDGPVLTNVIYDAADLPGRVEGVDDDEVRIPVFSDTVPDPARSRAIPDEPQGDP